MGRSIEAVATDIVDAAYAIHTQFGAGLLESAYQQCQAFELRRRGRNVLTEVIQPIVLAGHRIDAGYGLDMIVDDPVIVEQKAIEVLLPIRTAQLINYLRLRKCKLGFLINWNVKLIKYGITRIGAADVRELRFCQEPQ